MIKVNSFTEIATSDDDGLEIENLYQAYSNNKVLLNTKEYYLQLLEQDLKSLQENHNFKQSCGEVDLLTFV
jgi:hypothetical protein|tara:strand:- start:1127 stop:1339 length:213 start_codon:yes stop_codon:yes gene_type:complete